MHFYPNERLAIFIDGANLYATAKALGFDIDYKRLLALFRTKGQLVRALYYTARLRLPTDTGPAELTARIDEVLRLMELEAHRETLVVNLSGGQIKRVSLGAELLARPCLLYVDEAREDQPLLKKDFARVTKVAELKRRRGPLLIENIELDVLEGPKGDVFDRAAPPELAN